MLRLIGFVVCLSFGSVVLAAELSVPDTVPAGAEFEVSWSGKDISGAKIQVLDNEGSSFRGASYTYYRSQGRALKLTAPPEENTYAVVVEFQGERIAQGKFRVTPVAAALTVESGTIEAGGTINVLFTGPSYPQDIVSVTKTGATQRSSIYTYPANSKSNRLALKAPAEPGEYHVIYFMKDRVLARTAVNIGASYASLDAPGQVPAGGDVLVNWSGPDNSTDLVSLVAAGANRRSAIYSYVANSYDKALRLSAPEAIGDYELLYFMGEQVLARRPLQIVPVSASITHQSEVIAGQLFAVQWDGPGNSKDIIAVQHHDAPPARPFASLGYVVANEPVLQLHAPTEAGQYTVYYMSREGRVLANSSLLVNPAPGKPGFLKVRMASKNRFSDGDGVQIILDASGSMLQRHDDERRIDIAKTSIQKLLGEVIPAGANFALRAFGHREAGKCRTDLEVPLSPLNPAHVTAIVSQIQAKNLAKTPIADSLAKVSSDLALLRGEKIVVLLTDGEETCEGDAELVIHRLRQKDQNLRIHIVGYAIDDADLQATFASWAAAGGGDYYDASDAETLAQGLTEALQLPFQVFSGDKLVAAGQAGGAVIALPAGSYSLRYGSGSTQGYLSVEIRSAQLNEVDIP